MRSKVQGEDGWNEELGRALAGSVFCLLLRLDCDIKRQLQSWGGKSG